MKVGGACKWLELDGSIVPEANFRGVTVRRLVAMSAKDRVEVLLLVVMHNTEALRKQIEFVAALPEPLRMWRISSDLLPLATHPVAAAFYKDPDVENLINKRLAWCGRKARKHGIRLSFHPGQFVVLGSQNPGIRENSMRELEYHCDCFTRMGYSGWHPDGLAVNVHVGVKEANVKAMRLALKKAQSNVRNFVTLENDEFSWGSEAIVETFGDLVPLVLDVHHHWINEGKRLSATSPLVDRIRATWKGVRPKLHLAMSHPELCNVGPNDKLDLEQLLNEGRNRRELRAHSLHPWHVRSIKYAGRFDFDIMWEGKDKNVGASVVAYHLGLL